MFVGILIVILILIWSGNIFYGDVYVTCCSFFVLVLREVYVY